MMRCWVTGTLPIPLWPRKRPAGGRELQSAQSRTYKDRIGFSGTLSEGWVPQARSRRAAVSDPLWPFASSGLAPCAARAPARATRHGLAEAGLAALVRWRLVTRARTQPRGQEDRTFPWPCPLDG